MAYDNQYNNGGYNRGGGGGYSRNWNNGPRSGGGGGGGNWGGRPAPKPRAPQNSQNTNGPLFVNEQAGKFMRVKYWSQCMGLDIGTYAPGQPLDSNTIQNAQTFSHTFAFSAIYELLDICEEVLESIKTAGTFESTATDLIGQKKDAILEISNGENIKMPKGIYMVIYKNVDPGKRTNAYEIFPFTSTKVYRGYDHTTGYGKEDIKPTGDFKKFVKVVKEAAAAFTMAQAHAVADTQKGDKFATYTALAAISSALGVDLTKSVNEATAPSAPRTTGQSSYSRDGQPQNYQRRSAPGQWNRGGYQPQQQQQQTPPPPQQNSYQQTQQAMSAIVDEPVDINVDAAALQSVSLNDFK